MKQQYEKKTFHNKSLDLIALMNTIITDYQGQGFVLTVRQLYYQLVAGYGTDGVPHIQNNERSYKSIVSLVNDAKLAGLLDWDMIEDRTRAFARKSSWNGAASILRSAADGFHMDMWDNQPNRVFIIVEKEALSGIFERIGDELDIPVLAARGYPSGTVLRDFARRDLMNYGDQECHILHFGDHDPSGIDMSRDLERRLELFAEIDDHGSHFSFSRVALNMDQIRKVKPPKNPAKSTDARFKEYRKQFGESSWELDALNPKYLTDIVRRNWEALVDLTAWEERKQEIEHKRGRLVGVAKRFEKQKL